MRGEHGVVTRLALVVAAAALVGLAMPVPSASAGSGAREVTYRIAGDTLVPPPIAAGKHRFFARFPELVELRARILASIDAGSHTPSVYPARSSTTTGISRGTAFFAYSSKGG
jgi:hypothetical protein